MNYPSVSIAIATLNRRDDLKETLLQLGKLDPPPVEILICLDGCTDDTHQMLAEFPLVRIIEHKSPRGSVISRDELFRAASGELIVSLDDDSYPVQPDFVRRLGAIAQAHPEAGVIAFQEIRPEGRDDRVFPVPNGPSYISSYANCAGAIRANLYGEKACYPHIFFHMYEEPDFCLQTYASGFGVLYVPSIRILHRYSHVGRNIIRRHHQHARNELLSVLIRCPLPHVFWIGLYRVVRQFIYAAQNGVSYVVREPVWWWEALKGARAAMAERRPVPWPIYWNWMRLARRPIGTTDELIARFPNLAVAGRPNHLAEVKDSADE